MRNALEIDGFYPLPAVNPVSAASTPGPAGARRQTVWIYEVGFVGRLDAYADFRMPRREDLGWCKRDLDRCNPCMDQQQGHLSEAGLPSQGGKVHERSGDLQAVQPQAGAARTQNPLDLD